jgi:hypothetical protein
VEVSRAGAGKARGRQRQQRRLVGCDGSLVSDRYRSDGERAGSEWVR